MDVNTLDDTDLQHLRAAITLSRQAKAKGNGPYGALERALRSGASCPPGKGGSKLASGEVDIPEGAIVDRALALVCDSSAAHARAADEVAAPLPAAGPVVIGLTSGASTPDNLVGAAIERLEAFTAAIA